MIAISPSKVQDIFFDVFTYSHLEERRQTEFQRKLAFLEHEIRKMQ